MQAPRGAVPAVGDFLYCRFPHLPDLKPGPKPRPVLVIGVEERTDGINLVVAYSTSQKLTPLHAGEFLILKQQNLAAYQLAGLSYDTKVNLKQIATLPWDTSFFTPPPASHNKTTPKLGTLHPSLIQAVQAAWNAAKAMTPSVTLPDEEE